MAKVVDSGKSKPRIRSVPTVPAPLVLKGVTYDMYHELRDEPANEHMRMTYHNGTLEIMSPEYVHELSSRRLGMFIGLLTAELAIPCQGTASTTFRRGTNRLKRGVGKEPDESFYFVNLGQILGKSTIDLEVDPPPDLWIEVDHRASSAGRLVIFAEMKVPEIWRYQVQTRKIWFGVLRDGKYHKVERSGVLPMLRPAQVVEAIDLGEGHSESAWIRNVQAWIRQQFVPKEGS